MKKNFKFAMLAFAALATTFTSCSNEGDEPTINPDGTKGSFTFTVKAGELGTRAVTTTQTADESALTTVSALIFRPAGNLEKVVDLTVGASGDLQATANANEYSLQTPIEVFAENKKIVLVGNITSALKSAIVGNGLAALTASYNETLATLTANNAFVMASAELTANVTTTNTAIAPFVLNGGNPIALERLAAKLAVVHTAGTSVAVAGGTIDMSKVEYRVDNMNTVFNLTTPAVSPFIAATAATGFQPVEADPNGVANNPFYLMENIANGVGTNATYARVRCKFVPAVVLKGDGTTGSLDPSGDFVTLAMADGTIAYFEDAAAANAYITSFPASVATGANPELYKDGLCDYGITLEKTANKFDVVRNTYYVVTVTGFGGIGIPTDPTTPILPTGKGNIKFDVVVKDWDESASTGSLS